jgi:hypothetical protein
MDSAAHDQIARLEQEIERLSESLERCRKVALAARIAIGVGCLVMAALLFGLIRTDALALMIGAIFLLGGIVLSGSNSSTARQIAAKIAEAEQQRAGLIGEIDLTLVPQPSRLLH